MFYCIYNVVKSNVLMLLQEERDLVFKISIRSFEFRVSRSDLCQILHSWYLSISSVLIEVSIEVKSFESCLVEYFADPAIKKLLVRTVV